MNIREWLTSLNFQLQTTFGTRVESRDTYWGRIIPGMVLLTAGTGVLTFAFTADIFDRYLGVFPSIFTLVPVAYFMYLCANNRK